MSTQTVKAQYAGCEAEVVGSYQSPDAAKAVLQEQAKQYAALFAPSSAVSTWNDDNTRVEVQILLRLPNREEKPIDSATFWIEDGALAAERSEMVTAGKATLLRLQRHITGAAAAPLTNARVEKLIRLVALLESAENEFVYGS